MVLFLIFVPSILQDGSRSLGLFRKGKICIIAKFYRTDLDICSHFRGGGGGGGGGEAGEETLYYSQIITVGV